MSTGRDEEEKTHQEHAQLMTELPKAEGWWKQDLFLYQGSWLSPHALLGALFMQNHFKPRPTDIVLSSFMKSGTTWLKSLMFSILNRSRYEFSDHPLLRQGPHECFPLFEVYITQDYPFTDLEVLPAPRIFASHLAQTFFPLSAKEEPSSGGGKFVYVCRDPKDVLVSKWHFLKQLRSKERPPLLFDEAFELFCQGVSEYGPYWEHVLGFWRASVESPDKILFLKYEEMMKEPEVHVKRLAEFMGMPISIEEEANGVVEMIVKLCSFKNLKNLEVNKTGIRRLGNGVELQNHLYFRQGEVGDWENHLTQEMRAKIDQITHDKFKGSGLTLATTPN